MRPQGDRGYGQDDRGGVDVICGLALQPAFMSGRFQVAGGKHLSVGDVANLVAGQSGGRILAEDFWPVGCLHPLCNGSTYLLGQGDRYEPFTRHLDEDQYQSDFDRTSPQGSFMLDMVAKAFPGGQLPKGLPILIMEYMDAWTLDLERAQDCNLAITTANGSTIPFCIYHLTDSTGKRLYPHGGNKASGNRS